MMNRDAEAFYRLVSLALSAGSVRVGVVHRYPVPVFTQLGDKQGGPVQGVPPGEAVEPERQATFFDLWG